MAARCLFFCRCRRPLLLRRRRGAAASVSSNITTRAALFTQLHQHPYDNHCVCSSRITSSSSTTAIRWYYSSSRYGDGGGISGFGDEFDDDYGLYEDYSGAQFYNEQPDDDFCYEGDDDADFDGDYKYMYGDETAYPQLDDDDAVGDVDDEDGVPCDYERGDDNDEYDYYDPDEEAKNDDDDDDDDNNKLQDKVDSELKEMCREQGLKDTGTRTELMERLTAEASMARETHITPKHDENTEYCFDKANQYRLVPKDAMIKSGRATHDMVLSPSPRMMMNGDTTTTTTNIPDNDELASLLQLLPDKLANELLSSSSSTEKNQHHNNVRANLIEVVLDVGRRPFAWMAAANNTDTSTGGGRPRRHFLGDDTVSPQLVQSMVANLHIGPDNRAGISGSLHRISVIRNRDNFIVGVTLRVGRHVPGNALMVADLLYGTNSSILFVGPPGTGTYRVFKIVGSYIFLVNSNTISITPQARLRLFETPLAC